MSGSTRFFTATAFSLIGAKPSRFAQLEPVQHALQIVAPRDLEEARAIERIDVDVEAPQTRVVKRLRASSSSSTPLVVSARSWIPGIAASRRISTGRSRRTSGSPPVTRSLLIPSPTATRTKRSISSKSRISLPLHELHVRLRHAVEAADVAAVGDADAQVVVHPAEGIE